MVMPSWAPGELERQLAQRRADRPRGRVARLRQLVDLGPVDRDQRELGRDEERVAGGERHERQQRQHRRQQPGVDGPLTPRQFFHARPATSRSTARCAAIWVIRDQAKGQECLSITAFAPGEVGVRELMLGMVAVGLVAGVAGRPNTERARRGYQGLRTRRRPPSRRAQKTRCGAGRKASLTILVSRSRLLAWPSSSAP